MGVFLLELVENRGQVRHGTGLYSVGERPRMPMQPNRIGSRLFGKVNYAGTGQRPEILSDGNGEAT